MSSCDGRVLTHGDMLLTEIFVAQHKSTANMKPPGYSRSTTSDLTSSPAMPPYQINHIERDGMSRQKPSEMKLSRCATFLW